MRPILRRAVCGRPVATSLRGRLPERRDGRGRGDRLRVDAKLDQGRAARRAGALEGGREILGTLDDLAVQAVGARQGGEVGVDQIGARLRSRLREMCPDLKMQGLDLRTLFANQHA